MKTTFSLVQIYILPNPTQDRSATATAIIISWSLPKLRRSLLIIYGKWGGWSSDPSGPGSTCLLLVNPPFVWSQTFCQFKVSNVSIQIFRCVYLFLGFVEAFTEKSLARPSAVFGLSERGQNGWKPIPAHLSTSCSDGLAFAELR